uniref:hypothetical protein n=1 Tax=Borreliella garinii TaxID=29519 RepID=UPI0027DE40E0|nr:hypothetical protein [Borreliella garinii]
MEKFKLTLIIPLLIFTIYKIHSQSNIEYNFSYIINTKKENIDLKKGIEKQLNKIYDKITEHVVSNDDKNIIEDIYINQDIIKTELEISKLKKEMDKKKLQNIINAKEKHNTETKIDELKKNIQNIKSKKKRFAEYFSNNIFDISKIPNKEIEIQITSTNFENYSIKRKVKNADSIILNIDLKRTISKKVEIKSNVKSKVFKKGIFMGETPIEIEKPENQDIILLKSEGYKDKFKLINKEEDQVEIEMIKTIKNRLSNKRDKFYINLAVFTLSTIGTIFAGTLLNNAETLYKITGNHFINKMLTAEDVYMAKAEQMTATFLFGAGITLTIGSFISLITHLVEYIKEANLGE